MSGFPHIIVIGQPHPLPGDTENVGDDAFPLQSHMMIPFGCSAMSRNRLSQARRVVENALAYLKTLHNLYEDALPCDAEPTGGC